MTLYYRGGYLKISSIRGEAGFSPLGLPFVMDSVTRGVSRDILGERRLHYAYTIHSKRQSKPRVSGRLMGRSGKSTSVLIEHASWKQEAKGRKWEQYIHLDKK